MNGEAFLILLVEDDPAHAEIVRRNLEDSGVDHRLVHVTDGQAALDYLFREGDRADPASSPRPGLVLLDLRLPKVDGMEVLATVKADPGLRSIPVVVLTTSATESDRARAHAFQANSYLVKPVDLQQFTELLHTFSRPWLACNQFPT